MKINRVFLSAAVALSLAACGTPAEDVSQAEVSETTPEQTETEVATTSAETTTTEETTTVTEGEKVCTCESEFQHACCEYLNGLSSLAGGVYYGDINGDDAPEAIVEINPFQLTFVLYENENGMRVLELPTEADRGRVRYIADTKQILFNPRRDSSWRIWGYEEYRIYSWNGTDYEETSKVYREPGYYYENEDGGHSEYGQAYIDGEKVDNDTFEVRLAEMQELTSGTDYFPVVSLLNDEIFESYMKENFPCFDNWDSFPVKEGSL